MQTWKDDEFLLDFMISRLWRSWRAVYSYFFGTTIFFPSFFSMFLSLILYAKWNESGLWNKVPWLKKRREMNSVSYYPYFLSVQAQGGDLTF